MSETYFLIDTHMGKVQRVHRLESVLELHELIRFRTEENRMVYRYELTDIYISTNGVLPQVEGELIRRGEEETSGAS